MPAVRPKSRMKPAFRAMGVAARGMEIRGGFISRIAKPGMLCAGTQVSRSDDTGVRGPIPPFCTSSWNSASVTGPIVSFANLTYHRLGSIARFSGRKSAFSLVDRPAITSFEKVKAGPNQGHAANPSVVDCAMTPPSGMARRITGFKGNAPGQVSHCIPKWDIRKRDSTVRPWLAAGCRSRSILRRTAVSSRFSEKLVVLRD